MSSIEKRLRDELGELASWLTNKRAAPSSVEQVDSGDNSMPQLDLDADTVRSGGRGRLFRVAAALLLIVGIVSVSGLLSEDAPSVVTAPTDPATQTPTTSTPPTTTVDDLSSEDPVDGSSLVELDPEVDPEVDPDAPLDVPLDESSIQVDELLIGPIRGQARASPWLVPWGDGFLKIGHLVTTEQGHVITTEQDRTVLNLVGQTLNDGLNWEEPFLLNIPREHYEPLEADVDSPNTRSWPIISSNGEHLIVVSQLPGQHFGDAGANAATYGRSAPTSAHLEQRVLVSVTDDLNRWDHYEYSLLPPDGIDESLADHVVAEDIIVTNEGWMIQLSTLLYMDVGLLVPSEIQESAKEIWQIDYTEGRWVDTSDGLLVGWEIEDPRTNLTEIYNEFFSWEELNITKELFETYGVNHTKPYHFSYRYSGSVLVAKWGEGPVRAELPSVQGFCCKIIATDAGYVGLSDAVEPGYDQGRFGWGTLITSLDGLTWQRLTEAPPDEVYRESESNRGEYCEMWVPLVRAIESGVVMYGVESYSNKCGCALDESRLSWIWVGDAMGMNWEMQEVFDNPCNESYRVAPSVGKGMLIDIYLPFDSSGKRNVSGERYQSTVVSIDGINWFTFHEDYVPRKSSVAFNGNVAVRVDDAGNSYRYELQ